MSIGEHSMSFGDAKDDSFARSSTLDLQRRDRDRKGNRTGESDVFDDRTGLGEDDDEGGEGKEVNELLDSSFITDTYD